jgi:hypothetical protein
MVRGGASCEFSSGPVFSIQSAFYTWRSNRMYQLTRIKTNEWLTNCCCLTTSDGNCFALDNSPKQLSQYLYIVVSNLLPNQRSDMKRRCLVVGTPVSYSGGSSAEPQTRHKLPWLSPFLWFSWASTAKSQAMTASFHILAKSSSLTILSQLHNLRRWKCRCINIETCFFSRLISPIRRHCIYFCKESEIYSTNVRTFPTNNF